MPGHWIRTALVATVVVASVGLSSPAGAAGSQQAGQVVAARPAPGHAIKPLSGCAVTLAPAVGSDRGRVCLRKQEATNVTASPQACSFDYYENGPWGSPDWGKGWGICVSGQGYGYVPLELNDQASSWDSCSDGFFYTNQPGTEPSAYFPAGSIGNFPIGGVANDALSSFWVDYAC
jgi:hypothetical protein